MNQQPNNISTNNKSDDVVVSVKNVSKKFCKNLKHSMAYGIVELSKNLMSIKPDSTVLRKNEFWAVDDVSFELRRGETLGLIGVNGSGKSTLLRLLTGIFPPDKGEISVKGRVGALIAIGAGFHPHMTGRENIYLNATILGMSRKEIDSKFRDIVNFSEIGGFLEAPVSTYSSGMRVRLGFSIAMHIKPDILIVDEVLAVGDAGFKTKCINAFEMIRRDASIIFVSHHMAQISRICSQIIVLDRGKAVFQDKNVSAGIEYYVSSLKPVEATISGNGKATIHKIRIFSDDKEERPDEIFKINYLDNLYLEITLSLDPEVHEATILIAFQTRDMEGYAQCWSHNCNFIILNMDSLMTIRVKIPKIQLSDGIYYLTFAITNVDRQEIMTKHFGAKQFQLTGAMVTDAKIQLQGDWTYI